MYLLWRRAKEGLAKVLWLRILLSTCKGRCGHVCSLMMTHKARSRSGMNCALKSALPLKIVKRDIAHIVKKAKRNGVEWVFIDTPPNNSVSVIEAIEAATLVIIPCRPGLFDIDAVQETIALARQVRTPYAVVFNAAPAKRQEIV